MYNALRPHPEVGKPHPSIHIPYLSNAGSRIREALGTRQGITQDGQSFTFRAADNLPNAVQIRTFSDCEGKPKNLEETP